MSIEKTSVDDLGTDFQATIMEGASIVDISLATLLEIEFTSPGGKKFVKTASLLTDGLDGGLHYKRLAGDITKKGTWSYIGIATFSATEKYRSVEPTVFEVI